jgi:Fe(3+) dicitrate transport protein
MRIRLLAILLICTLYAFAQQATITGSITTSTGEGASFANLYFPELNIGASSAFDGSYEIKNVPDGEHRLSISFVGYQRIDTIVSIRKDKMRLNFTLVAVATQIDAVDVNDEPLQTTVYNRLKSIEGVAIYAAKKNEVIEMKNITANTSSNNARQVFARVPGINVWESDAAGLQLGVGARGLSPDRTANFNTRQNGYDMAADALGYPESYYAPPMQAIDRIEIVRGAASLQYGTQFGGMINLKLKQGNPDKAIGGKILNTYNSVGYFNTFNEIGGQTGKLNYYSFYNHRSGTGFRPNTRFNAGTGYVKLQYNFTEKLKLSAEYTNMSYEAQQPGGLTDVQFAQDPYQSLRNRNWFKVNWNLFAVNLDYELTSKTIVNSRFFGIASTRQALGYLRSPNRPDGLQDPNDPASFENRDLIVDFYRNVGNETRLLHKYQIKDLPTAFLIGGRIYKGYTTKRQGYGSKGTGPDFSFSDALKSKSDYEFPSTNLAAFAENIFNINDRLSITPGIRYEYIRTTADGFYDSSVRLPLTGEIVIDSSTYETKESNRSIVLAGIGVAYRVNNRLELYTNFSQNYRAITFTDMRVVNPGAAVDTNLQDERGFNLDLGIRGNINSIFTIDAGIYWLSYTDKIGSVQYVYEDRFFGERIVRLTTNVADAEILGVETYLETDILKLVKSKSKEFGLSHFLNFAYTYAYYHNSRETAVEGNQVESVPAINLKTGLQAHYKKLKAALQFTYLSQQFTEATNAEYAPTGVYGLIPSYWVLDLSLTYEHKRFSFEGGVNNLTNNAYFTRRAVGYPGPGIIPASPLNFYLGIGVGF